MGEERKDGSETGPLSLFWPMTPCLSSHNHSKVWLCPVLTEEQRRRRENWAGKQRRTRRCNVR